MAVEEWISGKWEHQESSRWLEQWPQRALFQITAAPHLPPSLLSLPPVPQDAPSLAPSLPSLHPVPQDALKSHLLVPLHTCCQPPRMLGEIWSCLGARDTFWRRYTCQLTPPPFSDCCATGVSGNRLAGCLPLVTGCLLLSPPAYLILDCLR